MKIIWPLALLLFVSTSARSEDRLCLSLGGGGARGLAHLGVLDELEKNNIKISCIAGTSTGALMGGLFAAGYSAHELISIAKAEDWQSLLFDDEVERSLLDIPQKIHSQRYIFDFELGLKARGFQLPSSLSSARKFRKRLRELLPESSTPKDFDQLPIPFRALATDLESGKPHELKSGSLSQAILASSAFPGVFSPVEIEGRWLVDGGSIDNLPSQTARKMAADYIVAVDLNPPLLSKHELGDLFRVSDQAVNIMMIRSSIEGQKADLLLRPEVGDVQLFEFSAFERSLEAGRESIRPHIALLKKRFPETLLRQKLESSEEITISKINLHGLSYTEPKRVMSRLGMKEGEKFDEAKIQKGIESIEGLGDYESVDYSLDKKGGNTVLDIRLREKAWGPSYLRIGYTWDGEIQGRQDFNAFLNLEFRHLNYWDAAWTHEISLGTQLSYESEFRQPLGVGSPFFISLLGRVSRSDQFFYAESRRVAQYEFDEIFGGADFGFYWKRYFEIRTGIRTRVFTYEREIGQALSENGSSKRVLSLSSLVFDQLDSVYFPREGFYVGSQFSYSFDRAWGEANYQLWENELQFYLPISRLSLFVNADLSSSLRSDLGDFESFTLGGFGSLGGYRNEELRGQHRLIMRGGLLHELPIPKNLLFSKSYLGLWWETASIEQKWDRLNDDWLHSGNLAAGFDTPLGAVFLGYGQSGHDNRQFYISAGRSFGKIKPH